MTAISNLDISSNLNLTDLYNNLQSAEQAKLTPITNEATACKNKISAFGQLQSSLQNLQSAIDALTKTTTFNATAVTSNNLSFSASTDSSAIPGNYQIKVTQLATAQSLLSGKISSSDTALGSSDSGSRTLTLQTGQGSPVTLTLTDKQTSLSGIVDAINQSGAGINATSIRAADGEYYLSLTAKDSGEGNDISVSVSGDDQLQSVIGYSAADSSSALHQTRAAQNTKLTVNGIAIDSKSNTVTNAPSGVTLSLKSVSQTEETLEIGNNTDDTVKAVKNWVTAYNKLQSTIASLTSFSGTDTASTDSTSNGPLIGDGTVRNIQVRLQSMLTQPQQGAYSILAQLGISMDPNVQADGSTGILTVDDSKLNDALQSNPQAVISFFTGDGKTSGFATAMNNTLSDMLNDSVGNKGMLANAIDSLNSNYEDLSKRYDSMQSGIDSTMARYKTQFTQLNKLMSQMDQTKQYLTSQFDNSSDK
ncbi:flagellar filament capping protein FliD [Tatumella citrea]|uniref:Flagellar hook-associated protein 2 n=1 Tax=Tatumella citrea TaxID=53336 RepID=A0A1Y0L884_TATCI|nr:flagellar filament capping protein FliD [Tatumella citrea]ARU94256.1 flagellar filament capping protein FliD [Tatumella citrea]ARU98296.1 flagellar filament capping protein FliD [Tatumella citrea]